MSKIKNFFKDWVSDWSVAKSLITVGVAFAVLIAIVLPLSLSVNFLTILGSLLILSGILGVVSRIKKGFKGKDKVTSSMLTVFFIAMSGIGVYLLFI